MDDIPSPGTTFEVQISGETLPLLGNEYLLEQSIGEQIETLLGRRGYSTTLDSSDYMLSLAYRTSSEKEHTISSLYLDRSSSVSSSSSYVLSGAGLGIDAANAVHSSSSSVSMATTTVSSQTSFVHTIAMELSTEDGVSIWKGDATWSSAFLEIRIGSLTALQLLLARLPSDPAAMPFVPMLRQERAADFLRVNCTRQWFSCPALPARIRFAQSTGTDPKVKEDTIRELTALPAIMDLIQTAEFAIPVGTRDWSDPLNSDLWKKAILLGKYYIGDDDQPKNVVVRLTGAKAGYTISEAGVLDDEDYAIYEKTLGTWQARLRNFFSFYEE